MILQSSEQLREQVLGSVTLNLLNLDRGRQTH